MLIFLFSKKLRFCSLPLRLMLMHKEVSFGLGFLGLKKHGLFKAFFVFDTLQFVGGRRQSTADCVP